MRHNGRDDDQDGGEEVGRAVEVPQGTDLPRQRHLVPEEGEGTGKEERRCIILFDTVHLNLPFVRGRGVSLPDVLDDGLHHLLPAVRLHRVDVLHNL